MQYLSSLRTLHLNTCGALESLPRSLKFLTKLEHLEIHRCRNINLQMEPEKEEDQHLRLSLKTFSIWDLPACKDLPRLLLEGSSSTLQWIKIESCYNFVVLPEWLQNLTSLQKIEILGCRNLSSLPEGMNRLTALTQVNISRCPTLTERCRQDGGADWPKIGHVQNVTLIEHDEAPVEGQMGWMNESSHMHTWSFGFQENFEPLLGALLFDDSSKDEMTRLLQKATSLCPACGQKVKTDIVWSFD